VNNNHYPNVFISCFHNERHLYLVLLFPGMYTFRTICYI